MPDAPSSNVSPPEDKTNAILLLGAGRMGGALLKGWLADPAITRGHAIHVADPVPAPWVEAAAKAGDLTLTPGPERWADMAPSLVLIAVKPQIMDAALEPLRPLAARQVPMVSIAAGRSIASLNRALRAEPPIIRVMPNTPMAIGRGVSVCVAGPGVSKDARALCSRLMEAGGPVFWIEEERAMDAVTGVSGSGPAYIFHMAECLADAGVAAGLDRALARDLARLTVAGAGALLWEDGADPAALREAVTSPGGTTAAALSVLQGADGRSVTLRSLVEEAVGAAAARGRDLDASGSD